MGIVNVTPDSFSDGGIHADPDNAVARALRLVADGAHVVDIGGESTRPGACRIDATEELRRVLPVVETLARAGVTVSIDTMRARTAAAALEAGAQMVNDVSGGLADPDMGRVIADSGTQYVVMHWRAFSTDMAYHCSYDDVTADVRRELAVRVDSLLSRGVDAGQLILDPGLGFAKRPEHNWQLLARLDRIVSLGFPVLVGASRKSFLGELTRTAEGVTPPEERDSLTATVTAFSVAAGASWVRVHDVSASRNAALVAHALSDAYRVTGGG
ncbi:dihydropteroate synthase [Rhodococcus sp. 06-221-2]|uniref:dihydropteroate synthase n=1 Tax=Nocardiaceae TaxID=85025 RepID=UPI000B9A6555|nr:dihydropteroate synthase [Rhodococcus sp. 06-221-2]NIL84644.1 Dihydropteroate synthase [Rhodococcus fascians]OZD00357.1 dihydropteroate synthase [Rhodococcus sp. 06-221-2]